MFWGNVQLNPNEGVFFIMAQGTLFIREATQHFQIQQIESILNGLNGVERVLVDTDDGEIKIQFNETIVTKQQILDALKKRNYQV